MDIVILRMLYPNDPTRTLCPHQHFVYEYTGTCINLYTVSSVLGKEKRIFDENNNVKEEYELIKGQDVIANGFKTTSFIDCTKRYSIELDEEVNFENLSSRTMTSDLKERTNQRIQLMIEKGKHEIYDISVEDIKRWNHKFLSD